MPLKLLLISISIFYSTFGNCFSQNEKAIILKIEDSRIPVSEYLQFVKQFDPEGLKSKKENSKIFIEYQLKLYEARQNSCDKTDYYFTNLEQYRNMLAKYMLAYDRLDERKIEDYYSRILKEIDISHIQINIKGDLNKDTLVAFNRTDSIRQLVMKGEDFSALAHKYSPSPESSDSGHIGYISGMQISFPLEELAFTTPVGEVSRIFRTSDSYHLIMVHQEKKSRGFMRVDRIVKKAGGNFSEAHNKMISSELDSIKILIVEGADFDSISNLYSDLNREEGDASEGIWLRSRGLMEEIVDAAFNIRYDGELSTVLISYEGYHILKRLEYKPLPTLEEAKAQIIQYYTESTTRQNYLQDKFLRNVMKIYGFTFYSEAYERFVKYGEKSLFNGQWIEPVDLEKEQTIFQIGNQEVSYSDFSNYLSEQKYAFSIINYPPVIGKHFQDFFFEKLKFHHQSHLEETFPDFKLSLKIVEESLLMICIEDEIWREASNDSLGLMKYYNKNINEYFVDAFEGIIITFKDIASKQQLEFEINSSLKKWDDLAENLQKNYSDKVQVERVFVRKSENKTIDFHIFKSTRFESEYLLTMAKGDMSKLPANNFKEASSDVLIDYQKVYHEKWMKDLRRKYSLKFNKKLVK